MSLQGNPTITYTYLTRPRPSQTPPFYLPTFPEISGPRGTTRKPLAPETVGQLQARYNGQVKDWECMARQGIKVALFAKLSTNLVLPSGINKNLLVQPDAAWIAQKPERVVFANLGNSITAAALGLAIQQSARGLPSAAGSPQMVVSGYGIPAVPAPAAVPIAPPILPPLPLLPLPHAAPFLAAPPAIAPLAPAPPLPASDEEEEDDDPTGEWTQMLLRQGDIQPRRDA
ncbi:hypothetical protein SBOR_9968 [Sclerotinia borealis F-4128]|uniref:Uncharacterized protein n=1 Tax=Sclerotinia borealis (strain F-4128) TaxID=1432307 RepID=W9C1N9_SCLBF|nr:hypothetical protein SBOR_9968 [Sclerotinia borealis F-4128]